MLRSRWMNAAVVLLAAAPAFAAPVPAEKSPLAWVPASTPVVIHINGLHNLRDHLVAFLKNAAPDFADRVQNESENFFQHGFNGHKILGVPKDGHIFIALMDLNHIGKSLPYLPDLQDLAVIVAVDDYKTFRDSLIGETWKNTLKSEDGYESVGTADSLCFLVDRKDHAVVTLSKERAVEFARGGPGLDGRISKVQSDRLLGSDLGLYVSMDVLHKDYAEMVKAARVRLTDVLQKVDDLPDKTLKPFMDLVHDLARRLIQALDDSRGVLVTLDLHPDGLTLHTETEFRPGSTTAELLKGFKPTTFAGLDKMPAGKIYYVGMGTAPLVFRLTGTMLFSSLLNPNDEPDDPIPQAIRAMLQAGPTNRLLAVAVPPGGVEVWKFDDPEKAVSAQAKLLAAIGARLANGGVLRDNPEIKPHAQKYKDFDLTSVRMEWGEILAPRNGPKSTRYGPIEVRKLIGDGLNLWFGTDGKTFVQVTAADWPDAEKQLDEYFKGAHPVGDDAAFAGALQGLPSEATILAIIDLERYAEALGGVLPKAPVIPDALQGKPLYVGAAATLEPERIALDLYVQAEAVRWAREAFLGPPAPGR